MPSRDLVHIKPEFSLSSPLPLTCKVTNNLGLIPLTSCVWAWALESTVPHPLPPVLPPLFLRYRNQT